MPSKRVLQAAFRANPHGCGFASPSHTHKGLRLNRFLSELGKVPDSEPCVMHFRLATHGSIKLSNCHPFRRHGDKYHLKNSPAVWFAHNGVLNIEPIGDRTDSETAFSKLIYPAIVLYGWGSTEADGIINAVRGCSRFALMRGGDVRLYGDFIKEPDGCYYSNLRFTYFIN